ncbi:MAG: uracil-DNA glycosylase [Sneathiellales bacterium]|nr:uracil-DNA glycosylase [Sneathiellales bacterium]
MLDPTEISEILNFYLEAGVDESIGDQTVNHFELSPPPQPQATPAPLGRSRPSASEILAKQVLSSPPALGNAELVEKAKHLAASCTTVDELKIAVDGFEDCSLRKMATHTVFAAGDPASDLLLIDKAPSSAEDRTGLPFSGESGELLIKMLKAIDIDVEQTYRISAFPWRPPGGRAPTKEEQALCQPFALRHLELASARHSMAFGEATALLTGEKQGINRLRGNWKSFEIGKKSIKCLPLFHPEFLLDHPGSKKMAWRDLLHFKSTISSSA